MALAKSPRSSTEVAKIFTLVDVAASHWLAGAGFNGTNFWPDIIESTPMVLANLQKAHVASVMSVLAPR